MIRPTSLQRPVRPNQARPTLVRVPADASIFRGWGVTF
jgi:hypothetical protein